MVISAMRADLMSGMDGMGIILRAFKE